MKISASSSMIFATLAISASSGNLAAAAPTRDANSESTLTSSPSGNRIASRRGSFARGVRPSDMQREIDLARSVTDNEARGILDPLEPLLGPIICPLVGAVITCTPSHPSSKKGGKQAAFETGPSTPMSPEETIQRFRSAIAIIQAQQANDPPYTPSNDGSNSSPNSGADDGSWHADVGIDNGDDYDEGSSPSQDDSDSSAAAAADYDPSAPSPPPNTPDMSSSAVVSSSVSTAYSSVSSASSTSASAEPTDVPVRRDLLFASDTPSSAVASSSSSSSSSAAPSSSSSPAPSSSALAPEPTDTLARRQLPVSPPAPPVSPSTLPVSSPLPPGAPNAPNVVTGATDPVTGAVMKGALPAVPVSMLPSSTTGVTEAFGSLEQKVKQLADDTLTLVPRVDPPVAAPTPVSPVVTVLKGKPSDIAAAPSSASGAASSVETMAPGPVGGAVAGSPVMVLPGDAMGVAGSGAGTAAGAAGGAASNA